MGYDRYSRSGRDEDWQNREPGEYGREYGYSEDYGRSSARDYAAAGDTGRWRGAYGSRFGREDERQERGAPYRGAYWSDGRRTVEPQRRPEGYADGNRDFFSRAGDEVRSWFGDEEAERRRALDARHDERQGDRWNRDGDYQGWRHRQIADLDRDYDEYRRENQSRFDSEFGAWRTDRQGQRSSLQRVQEHMEVVGSDGQHIGTVDKVRGDRIVLTRNDSDAGGHHHSIPSRWIETVDDKVTVRKTADEAKAAWRDEERSGALFGEQGDRSGSHYLNRSFSGTY